MNLSRDGLSIANMFRMASVRLNRLNRTILVWFYNFIVL